MKTKLSFWLLFGLWLPSTLMTLTAVLTFYGYRVKLAQKPNVPVILAQENIPYNMYGSLPQVLPATDINITTEDAIPILVSQYLARQRSPMLETSLALVTTARKYGLDPLLLVAIAQCESNLGKKMPADCNNPFGWGIHKSGTLCFSSWEEGYEKVAAGLKKNYVDQGLISPDEIMIKYNYASATERDGSWGKCVNKFIEDLEYLK